MRIITLLFASGLITAACGAKGSYSEDSKAIADFSDGYSANKNKEEASPPADITAGTATTIESEKKEGTYTMAVQDKQSNANANPATSTTLPDIKSTPKQLIQTADIKFQVEDLTKSTTQIEELISKHGAFVSKSSMETSYNNTENRMSIRVSPAKFRQLINELAAHSIYMNYKNISSEDVTAEYVDIETRLKTKREVEARYIDILKNKAKTVDDVLNAENEIRVIHEEIEAKVGRLNYLKDQVAYSTINLEFYQVTKITGQPQRFEYSYWGEAGDAFKTGWIGVKRFFIGLI
jgi:hypothetical protein